SKNRRSTKVLVPFAFDFCFLEEQDLMRSLVAESILLNFQLDVSNNNVLLEADKTADHLETIGGFWMDRRKVS
ncbi:MAG: hypothetical protein JSW42_11375, partial [Chloroflexota bacterium]